MKIDKKKCFSSLKKMREIEFKVHILWMKTTDFFVDSQGESVEQIKVLLEELKGLKEDVYAGMKELSDMSEKYLYDHTEVDQKSAERIRSLL